LRLIVPRVDLWNGLRRAKTKRELLRHDAESHPRHAGVYNTQAWGILRNPSVSRTIRQLIPRKLRPARERRAGLFLKRFERADMSQNVIDELKKLLIEGLRLEEITPDDIDPGAPLFGAGLGLDSIDALEIGVMLDRTYGVKIASGDERNPEIFASLNALADFVTAHRSK
jgi:acyl carrier protein